VSGVPVAYSFRRIPLPQRTEGLHVERPAAQHCQHVAGALLVGLACEFRSVFTCALDLLSAVGEERGIELCAAAFEVAFCHRFLDDFAAFGAGGPDLVADVWHLGGGGDGRSVRNCGGGGGDGDGRRRWWLWMLV
jgi:hypothetical protein